VDTVVGETAKDGTGRPTAAVLDGVAKLQSASAQGLAKVMSTGRYADSADTNSEEKALQRRIHVIRREHFHLLKLNNPDD